METQVAAVDPIGWIVAILLLLVLQDTGNLGLAVINLIVRHSRNETIEMHAR